MLLPILSFPDKRLRIKAKEVVKVDTNIQTLVANMFETMYQESGIGLAATQVNHHYRVIVMDVPVDDEYQELITKRNNSQNFKRQHKNKQLCFINPKLISYNGSTQSQEGCLSVPGFEATIQRYENIVVSALDVNGKNFEIVANGLLAICIQHEMDHLRGKLFVDYLSKLKQQRLKTKFMKL